MLMLLLEPLYVDYVNVNVIDIMIIIIDHYQPLLPEAYLPSAFLPCSVQGLGDLGDLGDLHLERESPVTGPFAIVYRWCMYYTDFI